MELSQIKCPLKNMKGTDGGVTVTVGMEVREAVADATVIEDSSVEPGGIGVYAIISSY